MDLIVFYRNVNHSEKEVEKMFLEISKFDPYIVGIFGSDKLIKTNLVKGMKRLSYTYEKLDESHDSIYLFIKGDIAGKIERKFSRTGEKKYFIHYKILFREKYYEVICTELEDTNVSTKRKQIQELENYTSELGNVIILCNTYLTDYQEPPLMLPKGGFYDAWREKGTEANKITRNGERPDRIWYKDLYCKDYQVGLNHLKCSF